MSHAVLKIVKRKLLTIKSTSSARIKKHTLNNPAYDLHVNGLNFVQKRVEYGDEI